ncbi:hypothetical protein L6164_029607 [Bauhinia variegata]|uniref:Uncharacterized protein n=1 Tax=Bauhinia variegata TaxID=167791 RepID=A0ACB9L9C4_BAUVA|nr:hypothetical protein L6164_029607 [Bauhinia variegata]
MAGKLVSIKVVTILPLYKPNPLSPSFRHITSPFRLPACFFVFPKWPNQSYRPTVHRSKSHRRRSLSFIKTATLRSTKVKKLSERAILPSRASPLSAGYDLSSAAETKVPARGKALVPTDLSISIPEGTYARMAPRSGLAWKHSIDTGASVIDADYRGPIWVLLFNHSDSDFEVKVGDRIGQLIIERIMIPEVVEVQDLDSTVRGEGGFGSTGV